MAYKWLLGVPLQTHKQGKAVHHTTPIEIPPSAFVPKQGTHLLACLNKHTLPPLYQVPHPPTPNSSRHHHKFLIT